MALKMVFGKQAKKMMLMKKRIRDIPEIKNLFKII
jgi:hypothetical protein